MSPFYSFECDPCKIIEDHFFHMNDKKEPECTCGRKMKRIFCRPNLRAEFFEYNDPTLGYCRTRSQKERKMKENGLTYYEPTHFKGEPGSLKRERYRKYADKLEETKDYYKHKDIKYYEQKT